MAEKATRWSESSLEVRGGQRKEKAMRFEGAEFIVRYCAAEVRVEVKMGQSFTWGKPKRNLMFAGANRAQNGTGENVRGAKGRLGSPKRDRVEIRDQE